MDTRSSIAAPVRPSAIRSFSRRALLGGAAAIAVGAAVSADPSSTQEQPPPALATLIPALKAIRERLAAELASRVAKGKLVRPDGYIYSVDAAQLMVCFAQLGDLESYQRLHDHCVALVRDERDDPFTRGFIAWRAKPGEKPDASGTTEALRLAKALWIGATRFARPADADLAKVVLSGYAQHGTTDQGTWYVRNYFSFKTRAFATNSYLVDYDPDLVRLIADATKDPALDRLATDCLTAVRKCVTPCGLFYDLIQPELRTLYPELAIEAFSPNDVVGLFNCCTTAMGIAKTAPDLASQIVRFALDRRHDLKRYYLGRNGWSFNADQASINEYTALCRLSKAIGDERAAALFLGDCLAQCQWVVDHPEQSDAFALGEILQMTLALT